MQAMDSERDHKFVLWEAGAVIGGRYRVVRQLGQGGMGVVYAAEDMRLHGKLRALKVTSALAGRSGTGHSVEEAAILMRLNHPHLPLIIDYLTSAEGNGCEVMVMDFIDGMTLQAYLTACSGIIGASEAIAIGIQLCDALQYLHAQQPPIIHRDLKPTNVMIDHTGFVRLIDFGIAREFKPGKPQDTVMLGTPGFSAPEQAGEGQSDARTDVFGLGSLLYYLMAGGRKLDSKAGNVYPTMLPHFGTELASVINRMADVRPSCRYGSMEEAKKALESCLTGPSAPSIRNHAKPGLANKRKRSVMVASLAPGAGATFVAITLAHLLDRQGFECAAIEHPELEPEWQALLYSLDQEQRFHSTVQQAWPGKYRTMPSVSRRLHWHMLEPSPEPDDAEALLKFRFMLEGVSFPITITDVSSKWMASEHELQLTQCDVLLFVVDPFVSKWTTQRLRAVERVCFERMKANRVTHWIANKDFSFRERSEWLSMLPVKPICSVPLLPPEQWADQLWSGKWATTHKAWLPMLERAFKPIVLEIAVPQPQDR
ncbi:serine/threonine protein kinase [Paenibacillus montanisoli]|nr:serine/threonine-protein kinase [Paenibacillus montanisoli]